VILVARIPSRSQATSTLDTKRDFSMNNVHGAPAHAFAAAPMHSPANAYDVEGWKENLLTLNAWAREPPTNETDVNFQAARQTETLKRYSQGRESWNAWAAAMLSLQAALKDAGEWAIGQTGEGENYTTRLWLTLATAVFSTADRPHEFPGGTDFRDLVFPANVVFLRATFRGIAQFQGVTFPGFARFDGTKFLDDVFFIDTLFGTTARFTQTLFSKTANFQGARVLKSARFSQATFKKEAHFGRMAIEGSGLFGPARFEGSTHFHGVQIGRRANFTGAHFLDSVDFSQSEFKGTAVFANCFFKGQAVFDAVDSQGAVSLEDSIFRRVPSFIGATFRGLRLDNITTPTYPILGLTRDKDASARFRELKRRASEAQDHDRELEFFAQEIRTGRFRAKGLFFFVPHVWQWRFWFGLAYGTFSDFGRSLLRPALVWLALLVGFAVFYLGQHESPQQASKRPDGIAAYLTTARAAWANPPQCKAPSNPLLANTNVVGEAFFLSASNALVVFNIGRGDVSRRTYGCLYGFEHDGQQAPPIVPYGVAVASSLQTLASAVLIFLFLLAVRNLLRLN
jgi:uncharacterized protein YjbI with pentapeptide repeats